MKEIVKSVWSTSSKIGKICLSGLITWLAVFLVHLLFTVLFSKDLSVNNWMDWAFRVFSALVIIPTLVILLLEAAGFNLVSKKR